MDEVLSRDQNHITVLGGVTDDSNQYIKMFRVDPITKRLLISAIFSVTLEQLSDVTITTPSNGQVLTYENGVWVNQAVSSSTNLTIGTTTISSGNSTRILYDNSGVLGEYTISGTGNVAMTTSPVFTTPNIGTATGSITGNAATVTTNANLTGPITSSGNTTSIASQTGTGTKFVVDTSPTLVTPILGDATASSITIPSTGTGIIEYNTADQVTNFEKANIAWSSNALVISTTKGGSGSNRGITLNSIANLFLSNNNSSLTITDGNTATAKFAFASASSSTGLYNTSFIPVFGASTGIIQTAVYIAPTISQSSTAGYTAFTINPTESATGSGAKLLADFQVGGASKAKIDNMGIITSPLIIHPNNAITASGNAATVPVTSNLSTVTNNSAATLTITITTSGAVNGQLLRVLVLDFNAVAQTIAWVNTENSSITVPTTSNGSTTLPLTVGFQYNSATSKWRTIASA